jgi:hypothetical protein
MINQEALKILFDRPQPAPISEYHREQLAAHANHRRLKAERLAREAAVNS